MRHITFVLVILTLCIAPAPAQEPPPEGFPKFHFEGHDEDAKALSNYLWYHFDHRGGNGPTLFNKEYLLTADIWLGGAMEKRRKKSIQAVHAEDIGNMRITPEGYVETHQHFSHSHDRGWPFPLWTQADFGPDGVRGKAAGWHFQNNGVQGWVGNFLRNWSRPEYMGDTAAAAWGLENAVSKGIVNERWHVEATGNSPALLSPESMAIQAVDAPFLQLRWTRTGTAPSGVTPHLEWMREGDKAFDPSRRVFFAPEKTALSGEFFHSILPMHEHPDWQGSIKRMHIRLAPGESDVAFDIDSFFTAYDTRHTINNPIFIFACYETFTWTGDLAFLRQHINRMRTALRYQQTVMGGLEHNRIRNIWPGHDGLAGWVRNADGSKTNRSGHGIGNNYWDLMPFGWDDFYATYQYYAATLKMAALEKAIRANPGWDIPGGALALDPVVLQEHARAVKATANELFWNEDAGRFIASIDKEGVRHDYGYTFVNLDAIWYGIANDSHANDIMDWIGGKRVVEGDTSTGEDIYHWRFAPRATTLRNLDWYGQGWTSPESIPWGGQVQDGGAVLGFTFYDLWARLHVLGADDAWQRLQEILAWEREVQAEGGYRAYYADGKRGTTLQGGGTAGGLGIDHEFYESSLLPAIIPRGFLGIEAQPSRLVIDPKLPDACSRMGVTDLLYRNVRMDIFADADTVTVTLKDKPTTGFEVVVPGSRSSSLTKRLLTEPGAYTFPR